MGPDLWHSWLLHSVVPLGNQTTRTMNWYPTQSHNPDIMLTSAWPITLMSRTRRGSENYQLYKSLVWLHLLPIFRMRVLCSTDSAKAPCLVSRVYSDSWINYIHILTLIFTQNPKMVKPVKWQQRWCLMQFSSRKIWSQLTAKLKPQSRAKIDRTWNMPVVLRFVDALHCKEGTQCWVNGELLRRRVQTFWGSSELKLPNLMKV